MTGEEMVYASVQSVRELDQDPEAEYRGLLAMKNSWIAVKGRYPEGHPLQEAQHALFLTLQHCLRVYSEHLPKVYASEEANDAADPEAF